MSHAGFKLLDRITTENKGEEENTQSLHSGGIQFTSRPRH
jgi:hypothetical protein